MLKTTQGAPKTPRKWKAAQAQQQVAWYLTRMVWAKREHRQQVRSVKAKASTSLAASLRVGRLLEVGEEGADLHGADRDDGVVEGDALREGDLRAGVEDVLLGLGRGLTQKGPGLSSACHMARTDRAVGRRCPLRYKS